MIAQLIAWQSVVDQTLLATLFAYSQYIALRAGVFSVATAGFASIGAYTAGILTMTYGSNPIVAGLAGIVLATTVALLLALPLARLRGVFQAIATLAFVEIVLSAMQNATSLTRGALGINGIPKVAGTALLIALVALTVYGLWSLGRSKLGRSFDIIRQDETVAVSLGVSVFKAHGIAFGISGFLGGLAGVLETFHGYSITPDQFGFSLLVAALAAVILGGRVPIWGPLAGATLLTLLPELARPLHDYRMLAEGALLIAVMIFMPDGISGAFTRRIPGRPRMSRPAAFEEETAGGALGS